jgi:hypothetical protein
MTQVHPKAAKWCLSYSAIKHLLKSVDHFLLYKTTPFEKTDAMRFGSAFDRYLLEGIAPLILPAKIDGRTKEGKAQAAEFAKLYEEGERRNIEVVTAAEFETIKAMVTSINAHPVAKLILAAPRKTQAEFFLDYYPTPNGEMIRLYGKKDIHIDRTTGKKAGIPLIADVKTCESADISDLERTIGNFGYHIQNFIYILPEVMKGIMPDYRLIFVEKAPPHGVQVVTLNEAWLEKAREDVEFAARRLIDYRAGRIEWTGYSDKVATIPMPAYLNYKKRNEGGTLLPAGTVKVAPAETAVNDRPSHSEGTAPVTDPANGTPSTETAPHTDAAAMVETGQKPAETGNAVDQPAGSPAEPPADRRQKSDAVKPRTKKEPEAPAATVPAQGAAKTAETEAPAPETSAPGSAPKQELQGRVPGAGYLDSFNLHKVRLWDGLLERGSEKWPTDAAMREDIGKAEWLIPGGPRVFMDWTETDIAWFCQTMGI